MGSLRSHLTSAHGFQFEDVQKVFHSVQLFEEWKSSLENDRFFNLIAKYLEMANKKGEWMRTLICNRSGGYWSVLGTELIDCWSLSSGNHSPPKYNVSVDWFNIQVSTNSEDECAMAACVGQNCPLTCGDCDFCAHYLNCTYAAFSASKFESCKHVHLVGRFLQSNGAEWMMLPDPEPSFPEPALDEQEPEEDNSENFRLRDLSVRCSKIGARFVHMASQISSGTLEIGIVVNGSDCLNYMRYFRRCRNALLRQNVS